MKNRMQNMVYGLAALGLSGVVSPVEAREVERDDVELVGGEIQVVRSVASEQLTSRTALDEREINFDYRDAQIVREVVDILPEVLEADSYEMTDFFHMLLDTMARELGKLVIRFESDGVSTDSVESITQIRTMLIDLPSEQKALLEECGVIGFFEGSPTRGDVKKLKSRIAKQKEALLINQAKEDFKRWMDVHKIAHLGNGRFHVQGEIDGVGLDMRTRPYRNNDYGKMNGVDSLTLDGMKVVRVDSSLKRSLSELGFVVQRYNKYAESFKKLKEEGDIQLHFVGNSFFAKGSRPYLGVPHIIPAHRNGSEDFLYKDENGVLILAKRGDDFEVFTGGENNNKVALYDQWLQNNGISKSSERAAEVYVHSYLAGLLKDDEVLDRFLSVYFEYVDDSVGQKRYKLKLPVGRVGSRLDNDYWNDAKSLVIASLENKDGKLRGDCDDASFFVQAIWQAQGRNAHVIALDSNVNRRGSAHATTISIEEEGQGFTVAELSTFSLREHHGSTLEEALQKVMDRYNNMGFESWEGAHLTLDPNKIRVAGLHTTRKGDTLQLMYAASVADLGVPDLYSQVEGIQDLLFRGRYEEALASIQALPEERRREPLLRSFEVMCIGALDGKDAAARELHADYAAGFNSSSQEYYESILVTGETTPEYDLRLLQKMSEEVDSFEYTDGLKKLLFPVDSDEKFNIGLRIAEKMFGLERVEFMVDLLYSSREHVEGTQEARWMYTFNNLLELIDPEADLKSDEQRARFYFIAQQSRNPWGYAQMYQLLKRDPDNLLFIEVFLNSLSAAEKHGLLVCFFEDEVTRVPFIPQYSMNTLALIFVGYAETRGADMDLVVYMLEKRGVSAGEIENVFSFLDAVRRYAIASKNNRATLQVLADLYTQCGERFSDDDFHDFPAGRKAISLRIRKIDQALEEIDAR